MSGAMALEEEGVTALARMVVGRHGQGPWEHSRDHFPGKRHLETMGPEALEEAEAGGS